MIDYITQNLWLFWTVITIVCLIMELSSGDFYVTCFAIGALVAIFTAVVGLPFWVQVVVWAVCSVLSIWFIRPHLVQAIHRGADERKSNAEALIGQIGEVTQTIVAGDYGRVKLDGDDWKAEAPSVHEDIEVGAKVKVVGRESIILKVERCQEC
jgi:membrane protein implicated in regulation of membrane protease activity